eukprot:CAMPEP_0197703798 /NCGR_PEP_ID=MMETSP1338-20131121/125614_1 /TAXON_ID=43686 ORGANISM="Pelagodinium beii, Strain RCC1491" /NCGR_SAMPLE_ID=MMETSP1338 /ASSEMBLY_ACC=CAM_ASM_000754 /LENGTH=845 /DNA_ID=CAMNT_0043287697 /DNA_START=105 /DNA_END=2643 /DNA_ORIENTATION=+
MASQSSGYAQAPKPAEMPFDQEPGLMLEDPSVPYLQMPAPAIDLRLLLSETPLPKGASQFSSLHVVSGASETAKGQAAALQASAQKIGKAALFMPGPQMPALDIGKLLSETPLPKGASQFSSLHVVAGASETAKGQAAALQASAQKLGKACSVYAWPKLEEEDVAGEYNAFFSLTSDMILKGADRASLMVFIAAEGSEETDMAVAAILAMLPFRGVQAAFISGESQYRDPLACLRTASGLFEYCAAQPERMGRKSLAAIFGPLPSKTFHKPLETWAPLRPKVLPAEKPAPFKIGGLDLPMVTFEGPYDAGVARLTDLLIGHYGEKELFPVTAVGETGDALGYGLDIHNMLKGRGCEGYYFAHASGESYKRPDAYGKPALLHAIASAKAAGKRVVVLAVGGGVNGNAMGMIAALAGADFVEVPTTLMHYNDATTSAKKAFSLIVQGKILSKNILGTFYLPQLVFCISEVFLTLDPCSVHAASGEAAKTMSMLGKASSSQGRKDFHNILGAKEFASDFTRIAAAAPGFERLVAFLRGTAVLKEKAAKAGRMLRTSRESGGPESEISRLQSERQQHLSQLRSEFHEGLPEDGRKQVVSFLTAINEEVIKAKAMFLAYSDPFEKYRALLFEYAHTLGHGVEAFMNGLYRRAEALKLDYSEAFRLHGQCVGMAVLWAGEMSKELGHLEGDGYLAHQALVCLFNRFGGFDFKPLRRLCDELGVCRDEFCEGVLQVVRRDNKRGYCKCSPGNSVDQLVRERPGCLLRSSDPSAELRYLVEVSEEAQREVLQRAFEGDYDLTLVAAPSGLTLMHRDELLIKPGEDDAATGNFSGVAAAAEALDQLLQELYAAN